MSTPNPWLTARNILAVRLDNAGDIVMLGPALRAIKTTIPDARITLLASPAGAKAAPLIPWIDDVIVWRAVWQDLGHLPFAPARERELIQLIAARAFDAAVIFTSFSQTPHVPAYVCYLAGIPLRAGESKEFGGATLSTELRATPDGVHQVDRNLHLVQSLGFAGIDSRLEITIPPERRFEIDHLLLSHGISPGQPLAVLHPGASAEARRYPAARFAEVAALLLDRGLPLVVTGSPREQDLLDSVRLGAGRPVPILTDLTIQQYAALIQRASVVVTGNTLPMHLADATGTPVVALYSGTDLVSQWAPRRTPTRILQQPTACAPCYRFTCPIGLPCLDVAPQDVAAAVMELIPGQVPLTDNTQVVMR